MALALLRDGRVYNVEAKMPRNSKRHRLLFAVIKVAFESWPGDNEFQPVSNEHLRAYALTKAGHCTSAQCRVQSSDTNSVVAFLTAFMQANLDKSYVFFKETKSGLAAYKPKSVAYKLCNEDAFKEALEGVFRFIEGAIGVPVEELRAYAEREASGCVDEDDVAADEAIEVAA